MNTTQKTHQRTTKDAPALTWNQITTTAESVGISAAETQQLIST